MKGFASWFQIQSLEELYHAEKIYNYIFDQGEEVELLGIDKPPREFKSLKDLFEQTLAHEKKVTASIKSIVDLAKENDDATYIFLQWFVMEQVEEEATPSEILGRLEVVGDQGSGIFMMDSELGARVYKPPVEKRTLKLFLP